MPSLIRLSGFTRRRSSARSEEHTSELQSQSNLVCRLLLEKKKNLHSKPNTVLGPIEYLNRMTESALKWGGHQNNAAGMKYAVPHPNVILLRRTSTRWSSTH